MRSAKWSCLGGVLIAVACGAASDDGLNAGAPTEDASAGSGGTAGSGGGAATTGGSSSSTGGSSASGGTAGGGAQADASADGAPTSCVTSLDCVDDPNGKTICDSAAGNCVECLSAADCDANHDCTTSGCVAYTPCESDTDCVAAPQGASCNLATQRCVECVETANCGTGEACFGNECRTSCDSDNDCTPQGLLCDTVSGACVQCLNHLRCPDEQHCSEGRCIDDVCQPGTTFCEGTAVRACTEAGDGLGEPVLCPEACNAGACVTGGGGTGGGGGCNPAACPSPCAGLGACCTRAGQCGCTNFPFLICL